MVFVLQWAPFPSQAHRDRPLVVKGIVQGSLVSFDAGEFRLTHPLLLKNLPINVTRISLSGAKYIFINNMVFDHVKVSIGDWYICQWMFSCSLQYAVKGISFLINLWLWIHCYGFFAAFVIEEAL